MIIPIPCKFGEKALCNGKKLVFKAVSWYKWFSGMEYTYYFETGNRWNPTSFYVSKGKDFSEYIEVDDQLTSIFDFKEPPHTLRCVSLSPLSSLVILYTFAENSSP